MAKKKNDDTERLNFGQFADKVFWSLLTGCALFCSHKISTLTDSVSDLNVKLGIVMEHMSYQDKRIDSQDHRLEIIENGSKLPSYAPAPGR